VDFTTAEHNEKNDPEFEVTKDGGTAAFEAPETQDGPHKPMPLDLWSLGVSIYTCMYGRLPFNGPDMDKSIHEDPVNYHEDVEISSDLKALLCALMNKSPTERPTIV